jgi:hypothetical protein
LPEAERIVIFLRFFQGLSSSQIARRIDQPAGTVRWRIKQALEKLRVALDDQYGDRRTWMGLLVLPGGGESGPSPFAWGAGVLAAAVGLVLFTGGPPTGTSSGAPLKTAAGGTTHASLRVGPTAGDPRAVVPDASVEGPCPELEDLHRELSTRRAELATHGRLDDAFEVGRPNPVAQARLTPIFADAFANGPCGHALECRDWVCRLQTFAPAGVLPQDCRSPDPRLRDRRYKNGGQMSGGLAVLPDPVTGKPVTRWTEYHRLASLTGDPVPTEQQQALAPLAGGRHRPLPNVDGFSVSCRGEAARLIAEVHRTWDRLDRAALAPLEDRLKSGVRSPAHERALTAVLAARSAADGTDPPLEIECRGVLCAVYLAPSSQAPDALNRLDQVAPDLIDSVWFAKPRPEGGWGPVFVRLVDERRRDRPTRREIACRFADLVARAGVLDDCGRGAVAAGRVSLAFSWPETEPDTDGAARLTIDLGREPPDWRAALCVVDRLRALAETFDVPPLRSGGRELYTFDFPGTANVLGDEAHHCTR